MKLENKDASHNAWIALHDPPCRLGISVEDTNSADFAFTTNGANGYADKEAELFVNGARKAVLPDCVPADKLKDMPNLIHVKSCDEQRAKITG